MELALTVVDGRGERGPRDVLVTAPPGATLAELLSTLPELGSGSLETPWYVDGSATRADALIGMPPLLHGASLTPTPPAEAGPGRRGPLLELHVTDGPDSGQIIRLAPGRVRIGRSPDSDVCLHDRTLSRVHAELHVGHDGIVLVDRGTTNGTAVDGEPLEAGARRPVAAGGRIRMGGSTLVLRVPRAAPAATRPDGQGHLEVNRGPRDNASTPAVRLTRPAPPQEPERPRLALLTLVLPLLLSLVLAFVLHSAVMLLFGLMGPVMMASSHLSDRRGGRLHHRRRLRQHAAALARFEAELDGALAAEVHWRHRRSPDLAELVEAARGPTARLWCRRLGDEDCLRLRLGRATLPAETTVTDREGHEEHPPLREVPLEVSLPQVGVLGVAAPPGLVEACLHGLLGQVAGWHSPREVRIVVLAADRDRASGWAWLPWLPHAVLPGPRSATAFGTLDDAVPTRLAELIAVLDARQQEAPLRSAEAGPWPAVVVVLDGARRLRTEAGVSRLLQEGPAVGIYAICADRAVPSLPVETAATLDLTGSGSSAAYHAPDHPSLRCVPALVRPGWVERLARHLAPLHDATPEQGSAQPPDSARLLEILDVDATCPTALARRWREQPRGTSFVVGVAAHGPEVIDLRRDGPHVLVGGTTGAGKSELLQTMIASLAVTNRPDEMVFVLVDYKGGSAFKDCARLPHTAGLVTDLDGHLTARALRSLEAEIRRRERVFGAVGAKDLEDYLRVAPAGAEPVPRLVLVIDEFKMLTEDLPDFVDGLVRIAAVGRSLGVHLVLATQRPGGIVSSDIKANVNLRIALRVRDKTDSDDVVDDPAAAAISGLTPGRALCRTGSAPLRLFQTARIGGHERHEVSTLTVRPTSLAAPATTERIAGATAQGPTDLSRLVDAAVAATRDFGIAPLPSPWLPALADVLPAPEGGGSTPWLLPYGVCDLPDEQRRTALCWDLERDGHLAFAGSARSGRTTVLRTLAGVVAQRCAPTEVHLHAFDGSGGLRALTSLPHTGAVVTRDEAARGARLLERLATEVAWRQGHWAEHGYSSLAEQRDDATRVDDEPLPYLVLLVDGWDTFTETFDEVDHGRPVDVMLQLLREGPSVGLLVVVTGGRSVLLSRVSALVPGRFCLRMADDTDLTLAGLAPSSLPVQMPPGRAVRVDDGVEAQVGVLTQAGRAPVSPPDASGRAQVALLQRLGEECRWPGPAPAPERLRPLRVEPLPGSLSLSDIRVGVAGTTTERTGSAADVGGDGEAATADARSVLGVGRDAGADPELILGVGGDDLSPVTLDPAAGLSFLVAGPAGSGRTTTLRLVAEQLLVLGRDVLVVAERGSALADLAETGTVEVVGRVVTADPRDPLAIREAVEVNPAVVAVVDDVERLSDPTVIDTLSLLARDAHRTGGGVVCAGLTHELLSQFRGLASEVRRAQTGILLQPSAPADGELFAVRATPLRERVPGRGQHVARGRLTPIQVALPDPG